jgi:hypothetical protein
MIFICVCTTAAATWSYNVDSGVVDVNWKKFGNYQLNRTGDGQLEGSVVGVPDKWRKMTYVKVSFSNCNSCIYWCGIL